MEGSAGSAGASRTTPVAARCGPLAARGRLSPRSLNKSEAFVTSPARESFGRKLTPRPVTVVALRVASLGVATSAPVRGFGNVCMACGFPRQK